MLKPTLLCLALAFTGSVHANAHSPARNQPPALPGSEAESSARLLDPLLLTEISNWLSISFGMPAVSEPPRIEFLTPARMAAVRFRGIASDRQAIEAGRSAPPEFGHDIYALYDTRNRTIYLHERWTAGSPADVSILVHELVHHLQNVSGEKFACPHGREKDAYAAQRAWLAPYGRTLEQEFEIDAMTILVRSNCLD
jgi:hypothetical protein